MEEVGAHLYVCRIPPQPSTEEIGAALAAIRAWVPSLDRPYGWVNDPQHLRLATVALERKMIADHLRFVEAYSRRYCAGMATIVTSPTVRGVLTAIGWLYEYPFPTRYSENEAEALGWVRRQMAR